MSAKLFLSAESTKIPRDLMDLYLKRNLFSQHKNNVGIWLEYPLDLETLKLKIAFLESLLKKISPEYTKALNPIKLNIYFESI